MKGMDSQSLMIYGEGCQLRLHPIVCLYSLLVKPTGMHAPMMLLSIIITDSPIITVLYAGADPGFSGSFREIQHISAVGKMVQGGARREDGVRKEDGSGGGGADVTLCIFTCVAISENRSDPVFTHV